MYEETDKKEGMHCCGRDVHLTPVFVRACSSHNLFCFVFLGGGTTLVGLRTRLHSARGVPNACAWACVERAGLKFGGGGRCFSLGRAGLTLT